LSLQGSAQSPVTITALSIESNDDEEARFQADLARAIAASKRDLSPTTSVASLSSDPSHINDLKSAPPSTVNTQSNSTFLSERAQLEQERLARLKRLHDEPHPQDTEPPSKRPTPSRELSSAPASGVGPSQRGGQTVDRDVEVFWDGELRQTANAFVELDRNGEDGRPVFRLSQIIGDVSRFFYSTCVWHSTKIIGIQKSQIELAIISTYALQLSWIYTFFHPSTPVVLVTQPAPSENGNPTIKEVLPNWIRVTPLLRGGRGVMHMKVGAGGFFSSTFI